MRILLPTPEKKTNHSRRRAQISKVMGSSVNKTSSVMVSICLQQRLPDCVCPTEPKDLQEMPPAASASQLSWES